MGGWRKSTYSDSNGGQCVEVRDDARQIQVRDTTDRDGGILEFSAGTWAAFTDSLR